MAERRMFAKTIIDSDAFLEMPQSTQLLYFHLSMHGDDEGFINNPKSIMRNIGCKDDDIKILIGKKFLIPFESGVVVIKHWNIHNYIRGDRIQPTKYSGEKSLLNFDDNKSYTLCQADVSQMSGTCHTEDRLGKVSLGKDSIDIVEDNDDSFLYKSIIDYLNEKANTKFRVNNKATKALIHARIAEGSTLDDFKTVIDNKVADWLINVEMSQYLRPQTLFGTKFESYLNAKSKTVKHEHNDADDVF